MSKTIEPENNLVDDGSFMHAIIEREMRLRDEFAAAALPSTFPYVNDGRMTYRDAATEAYRMADAMMEVRLQQFLDDEE